MLSFKPVSINDRNIFKSYFSKSNKQNCDNTFSNIFSWKDYYKTAWCETDGFLLIRFQINGKRNMGYMEPLGDGDVISVLQKLKEDAHDQKQPLQLLTLSADFINRLQDTAFYQEMYWYPNRNFYDYIYSTQELATLAGKKLQAKRNHIHQFKNAYPKYHWERLERSRFEDAMQVLKIWEEKEIATPQILSEKKMILRSFDQFETLELRGGILYIENQPVAFTFGSELRPDTFCCHVEKADIRYEGVFPMINYLFANDLLSQYRYINREEDLGMSNLRKSKMSYFPEMMEEKWEAVEKDSIYFQIMQLWKTCFGDEDEYVTDYLHNYFDRRHAVLAQKENQVIGMFHLHSFETEIGSVGYLFALAVDPKHQHQGVASNIVRQSLWQQHSKSLFLTTLITYTDELALFYKKYGFADIHQQEIKVVTHDSFDFGADPTENIHVLYRILDAKAYLQKYAALHPDCSSEGMIKDDIIADNNCSFVMKNGYVVFQEKSAATVLSIEELFLHFPLPISEMRFIS